MDGDQWTPLVALLYLLQVRINLLLIQLFGSQFGNDFGPDYTFLHEICVETRVSQFGDDLDKLWICVLGDV